MHQTDKKAIVMQDKYTQVYH